MLSKNVIYITATAKVAEVLNLANLVCRHRWAKKKAEIEINNEFGLTRIRNY